MMTSRQALPTIILVECMTALSVDAVVAQEEFQQSFEAFAVAMVTSNPLVIPPGVSAVLQINFTRLTERVAKVQGCAANPRLA